MAEKLTEQEWKDLERLKDYSTRKPLGCDDCDLLLRALAEVQAERDKWKEEFDVQTGVIKTTFQQALAAQPDAGVGE